MCEVRFVECQYCEGAGELQTGTATIYEPGCGFWHDDAVMQSCPECEGTGRAETPVQPVECDDDLTETEQASRNETAVSINIAA